MAIYVIDGQPLMRHAVVMVARSVWPGVAVVEAASLGELEAALSEQEPPELFCLDPEVADPRTCEAVWRVKQRCPGVPVAVLSALTAAEAREACRAAGADAFVEKTLGAAELRRAMRGLLEDGGDGPEGSARQAGDGNRAAVAPPARLSPRQRQMVELLEQGLSNREIAARLAISENTVKVHLWRLFRRLGVKSRTQMVHVARQRGLIGP